MRRNAKQAKPKATAPRVIVGIEDMVLLPDVRDVGIVSNLNERLQAQQVYTFIGHVLVVANPFTWLRIYEKEVMKQYVHQSRVDVPPHIFATAEAAFRSLVQENDNQCIIISGESGAGKTEASKQIQSYIATVSGGGENVERIKTVFMDSNPVLEAFGNAKTLRNNNSSRFGKYFELKFDRFGTPLGGVITNYLLEKSRIVRPNDQERNFHIFYQLCSSGEVAKNLNLKSAMDFDYLSVSQCVSVDGINDAQEFQDTLKALQSVGLKKAQINQIFTLLGAILHLGNVKFQPQQVEGVEGSKVAKESRASLEAACTYLKIDDQAAVVKALTYRVLQTMAPGGKIDIYEVPQNPIQAAQRRDAISKAIFSRLFDLIVERINAALSIDESNISEVYSIGVLDIYGFEIFKNNSFEQLCINYVNEKLQQIFIELTLRAEQEEYEREGIKWEPIPFFNNRIVCELLDGSKPPGMFRILDDTCKTMHGTKDGIDVDKKALETCSQQLGKHAHFMNSSGSFTIKHYAGDVSYTLGKFADSNRDALVKDLLVVLKTSTDKLLSHIFQEEVDWNDKTQPKTAGYRIRVGCQELVDKLMECSPHYVRCIKSNDKRQPLFIDTARVTHQVKYLGLQENIKVRRAGFAYRAEYHRFLERFNILCPQTYPDWKGSDKDGCKAIVKHIASKIPQLTKDEAQMGKTKMFVRKPETYFDIERLRELCIGEFVAKIQRAYRKYISTRVFMQYQRAMAKFYADNRKTRRRDSIWRPYQGDYIAALGKRTETIKDAMFQIIDSFDSSENVLFVDPQCGRVVKAANANPSNAWVEEPTLFVLTNNAIYLMEIYSKAKWDAELTKQTLPPTKAFPMDVILRRRLTYGSRGSDIDTITVSTQGDGCIAFGVSSERMNVLPLQDKATLVSSGKWLVDDTVQMCPLTQKPFGLFTRRHHCRNCGGIFNNEACNFKIAVPDKGFYSADKVCNSCIGMFSIDAVEDVLLFTPKRSEIASLMSEECKKKKGSALNFACSATINLKSSRALEGASSRNCAQQVSFVDTKNAPLDKVVASLQSGKLVVQAPSGLTTEVVEDIAKRQAARQKKAANRRKKADEERRARNAVKEDERERERLQRIEEKKARKAAERESKREEKAEEETKKASVVKTSTSRKFGDNSSSSAAAPPPRASAASELAAAMQKRRASLRPDNE